MEAINDEAARFAISGSGSGSGDGSGDGNGFGSGFGFGSGSEDGNGFGYGYGSGYGSGSGFGFGSGFGSGYGYGYGCNIKTFAGQQVFYIDDLPTLIDAVRGNVAKGFIVHDDFTLIPCFIVKQDSYFAHGETLHKAHEALLDKLYEGYTVEERLANFRARFPDFAERVPARELYEWHHRLTGSCEMGRRSFVRDRGVDLDKDTFTIRDFVELTKAAYGGSVISQLINK